MRTSRFASLAGAVLILLTMLLTVDNQALAMPLSNFTITDMKPSSGECMPEDNIVTLSGIGLTDAGVRVQVRSPYALLAASAKIDGFTDSGIRIVIPQSTWTEGTYTITAVKLDRQTASFKFNVQLASPGTCGPNFGEGYSRGDG